MSLSLDESSLVGPLRLAILDNGSSSLLFSLGFIRGVRRRRIFAKVKVVELGKRVKN